jgi:hypothetical protein
MAESLYTGAQCDEARLGNTGAVGWKEVRGPGFLYCVPPAFVATGGDGKYWEAGFQRFSWGPDPRVTGTNSLAPFVAGSRQRGSGAEPPANDVRESTIDGRPARLTVQRTRDDYLVTCEFTLEMTLHARVRSSAAAELMTSVCWSVRLTR